MGIRNDVFLALKTPAVLKLPAGIQATLDEMASKRLVHEEGTAWFFEDVKWYVDLDAITWWLADEVERDEAWLVVACHDYPEADDNDWGSWEDNPWGACREVSVRVAFDHEVGTEGGAK